MPPMPANKSMNLAICGMPIVCRKCTKNVRKHCGWLAIVDGRLCLFIRGHSFAHAGENIGLCGWEISIMREETSAGTGICTNAAVVCANAVAIRANDGDGRRKHAAVWKFSGGRTEVFSGIGGSFHAFFLTFAVVNHNNLTG